MAAKLGNKNARKHGHYISGTSPTYRSWEAMKSRCLRPSHIAYSRYGGSGVTICDKWMQFSGFLEDMGPRLKGMTLDRIDNSLGYFKENCRWADWRQQEQNKSSTIFITSDGKTQCLSAWARELGVSKTTISRRRTNGWPTWKVLSPENWRNRFEASA